MSDTVPAELFLMHMNDDLSYTQFTGIVETSKTFFIWPEYMLIQNSSYNLITYSPESVFKTFDFEQ